MLLSSVHDNFETKGSPVKNGVYEKPLQGRANETYKVDGGVDSERCEAAQVAA
jgi:hypothetical protein